MALLDCLLIALVPGHQTENCWGARGPRSSGRDLSEPTSDLKRQESLSTYHEARSTTTTLPFTSEQQRLCVRAAVHLHTTCLLFSIPIISLCDLGSAAWISSDVGPGPYRPRPHVQVKFTGGLGMLTPLLLNLVVRTSYTYPIRQPL